MNDWTTLETITNIIIFIISLGVVLLACYAVYAIITSEKD